MLKLPVLKRRYYKNRGIRDEKMVSLIWMILLYRAVKMDSVVKFFFRGFGTTQ
jgi:hypothetical protein